MECDWTLILTWLLIRLISSRLISTSFDFFLFSDFFLVLSFRLDRSRKEKGVIVSTTIRGKERERREIIRKEKKEGKNHNHRFNNSLNDVDCLLIPFLVVKQESNVLKHKDTSSFYQLHLPVCVQSTCTIIQESTCFKDQNHHFNLCTLSRIQLFQLSVRTISCPQSSCQEDSAQDIQSLLLVLCPILRCPILDTLVSNPWYTGVQFLVHCVQFLIHWHLILTALPKKVLLSYAYQLTVVTYISQFKYCPLKSSSSQFFTISIQPLKIFN